MTSAQFWAYLSPQNATGQAVTRWEIRLAQEGGSWAGTLTSEGPREPLQTPELSGLFTVRVTASGPGFAERELQPLPDSEPEIGCNDNCAAMIGIVADEDGGGARYWTVSDALCR